MCVKTGRIRNLRALNNVFLVYQSTKNNNHSIPTLLSGDIPSHYRPSACSYIWCACMYEVSDWSKVVQIRIYDLPPIIHFLNMTQAFFSLQAGNCIYIRIFTSQHFPI